MQVNIELEYSVTDINKCYIVINDEFYVQIEPELWEALAEYFQDQSGDLNWKKGIG